MNTKLNQDPILLCFGRGFLGIADSIIAEVKQMRKEINMITRRDFPRIHIIDHDYDSEMNHLQLEDNEYVIKIYGVEQVRCQCDNIQSNDIIEDLKQVIIENIMMFNTK